MVAIVKQPLIASQVLSVNSKVQLTHNAFRLLPIIALPNLEHVEVLDKQFQSDKAAAREVFA